MERISVFDIFKIGIGPSSSHTMGPWRAAQEFLKDITERKSLKEIQKIQVFLYGSLAKTGIGHGTEIAVLMGLCNQDPVSIDPEKIPQLIAQIEETETLALSDAFQIPFDPKKDIHFLFQETLDYHPNGMKFQAEWQDGQTFSEIYFSIGGGFIVKEEKEERHLEQIETVQAEDLPYPVNNGEDLIAHCESCGKCISEVVLINESHWRKEEDIRIGLMQIWETMKNCIFRGAHQEGILPGGLEVQRRAQALNQKLIPSYASYQTAEEWITIIKDLHPNFQKTLKWVSLFALAVNEENAAFGRVVTAPTNGAAGVIPAVLMYYVCFCEEANEEGIQKFLLTAGELGSIFKKGSTISAAMGGCQAEIGVSSSMAAGALTEVLGGNAEQVLMAAEIAMEHHLGLTCDPIKGLVQIPCIERNTMGAIKAITASQIALESNPKQAKVSLDNVIKTMWETAQDMHSKYKETSEGGLATQVSVNVTEC